MGNTPSNGDRIEAIFHEALQASTLDERLIAVEEGCGGDVALRARVQALLVAHEGAAKALGLPPPPVVEAPGTRVGRYRLLEEIGEGGFAVVFMAEQQSPVRRIVALKIVKPGMDTRQVVARFEAERRALGMMEHENVARVFDAGTTDSGRPYFVMELVKGFPITHYCDEHHLTIRQRLDLFGQVARATEHAHQKGIIHRDLKPNNVLVATKDGRPLVKVIDFGIAKATAADAPLTDRTLYTDFRQFVGTPAYMSPEQADGSLDLDTRTDIYSLGVLLYELLAGAPPFDPRELRGRAFGEMQRVIREIEPPKPSTRLAASPERLTDVAARRATDPRKLPALVRGELDWIVTRCMEKDRDRRYQSAGELGEDLRRYLSDQPVKARPPTAGYRFRKFVRRNKAASVATAAAVALMLAAIVTLASSRARIRHEVESKDRALAVARLAVDQMLTRTADERMRNIPRAQPLRRALLEDALRFYEGFIAQAATDRSLRHETGLLLAKVGGIQFDLTRYDDSIASYRRGIALLNELAREHPDDPTYVENLASAENRLGQTLHMAPGYDSGDAAATHSRNAMAFYDVLERRDPKRLQPRVIPLYRLGEVARKNGDLAAALALYRQAVDVGQRYLVQRPEDHEARNELCWACATLADVLPDGDPEKLAVARTGVQHATELLARDPDSPLAHFVHGRLGVTIAVIDAKAGRYAQAVPGFRRAIEEMQSVCESAPDAQHFWGGLAWSWWSATSHLRGPELADAARNMRQWITHVRPSEGVLPQGERLSLMMELVGYLRVARLDDEADAFSREVSDSTARFVTRLEHSPADRAEAAHLFPMSQRRIAKWLVDHPDPAIAQGSRQFQDLAAEHASPD